MNMQEAAAKAVSLLLAQNKTVATAESCTGGLLAKLITDISGSSAAFCGGFVTYTNAVKEQLLGVDPAVIRQHTEVSHACAAAMAEGARKVLHTDFALSTTGYAGPTGGTEQDPVGTVYLALGSAEGCKTERFSASLGADRNAVREEAATRILELLIAHLEGKA